VRRSADAPDFVLETICLAALFPLFFADHSQLSRPT